MVDPGRRDLEIVLTHRPHGVQLGARFDGAASKDTRIRFDFRAASGDWQQEILWTSPLSGLMDYPLPHAGE